MTLRSLLDCSGHENYVRDKLASAAGAFTHAAAAAEVDDDDWGGDGM